MGEDLKKTDSANLFTVFGEPDFELRKTDDGKLVVDLKGVDVYDPTTREVRSNDTGQIALDDRHELRRNLVLRPSVLLHRRQ
jgi:adenine-specific DNA-methyltransferase